MEQRAIRHELAKIQHAVPEKFYRCFVRVSGAAEYSYIFNRLVAEHFPPRQRLRCLVVGLHGGRDYWNLVSRGHEVCGLDLTIRSDFPNSKRGNAEETWPFLDGEFDLVVLGEILEHLHWDMNALREARRVLRDTGQLIATVPFWDSNDSFHIRIHDPLSFQRLLQINGFVIDRELERPGIVDLSVLNYLSGAISLATFAIARRTLYGKFAQLVGAAEWHLGQVRLPRRLLKLTGLINWGGIYSCSVGDSNFDYVAVNASEFIESKG